jgi:hypothetical protein
MTRLRLAVLLLLLPLGGCYADQKKAMSQCLPTLQSRSLRGQVILTEEYQDSQAPAIIGCMRRAGYRKNDAQCLSGDAMDARCYIPRSAWGKFIAVFFESGR